MHVSVHDAWSNNLCTDIQMVSYAPVVISSMAVYGDINRRSIPVLDSRIPRISYLMPTHWDDA
eukprot:scaffold165363_cov14-Tisochrysis_lutea.AAC.1